MKTTILAAAAASALVFGGVGVASAMPGAGALPLAGASSAAVTDVAFGCGPGFRPGPYGRCRPIYGWGRPGWGRPGWRGGWHRGGWHRGGHRW